MPIPAENAFKSLLGTLRQFRTTFRNDATKQEIISEAEVEVLEMTQIKYSQNKGERVSSQNQRQFRASASFHAGRKNAQVRVPDRTRSFRIGSENKGSVR